MRCREVTRELAARTGQLGEGELAQHLASCPACQAWAEKADRLDAIWDVTRPEEPPGSFEATWARVGQALEGRESVAFAAAHQTRRQWMVAARGLAQAAAVLVVGFIVVTRMHGPQPAAPGGPGPQLALNADPRGQQPDPLALTATCPPVSVDAGQIVMIEMANCEGVKKEVADLYGKDLYMASVDMDALNNMEALAPE